jgi:hypothetical protein
MQSLALKREDDYLARPLAGESGICHSTTFPNQYSIIYPILRSPAGRL